MSERVHVVGGGTVGREIADRLADRDDTVALIERDGDRVRELEAAGYRVHHGDGTDPAVLNEAGLPEADVAVVATGDDDTNLLASQLIRSRFDPETVIARVNRPENEGPFADLGIETVSRPDATAKLIDGRVESPALTRWMESIGCRGDVQEVAVTNPEFVGASVGELDARLPEQVLLVMVGDEGHAHLPDTDEILREGDHVTLLGAREAVRSAMASLAGAPEQVPDAE